MQRVMIALAASAGMLALSAGAFASTGQDNAATGLSGPGAIKMAQAAGTSSGGKAVDQQFIDPNVKEAPGSDAAATPGTDAPAASAGSAPTTEPTTDESKVKKPTTGAPVK